jgi:hypothetical protein
LFPSKTLVSVPFVQYFAVLRTAAGFLPTSITSTMASFHTLAAARLSAGIAWL